MRRRKEYIAAAVLPVVLFFVIVMLPWKQKNDGVMKINGMEVGQEEFELILKRESPRVLRAYTTEEVNQEDFWAKEGETEKNPCTEVVEQTCSCLIKNYTLKQIAKDQGINIKDLEFDSIKENFRNRESDYGPEAISFSAFYDYLYTDLEVKVREKLKQKQNPEQEELMVFYEQMKEQNPQGEGMESFKASEGIVKSMYQEKIGNEQIEAAIADANTEYKEEKLKKLALDVLG